MNTMPTPLQNCGFSASSKSGTSSLRNRTPQANQSRRDNRRPGSIRLSSNKEISNIFNEFSNSYQCCYKDVVEALKAIDFGCMRKKLQEYCMTQFASLSLFLLYEVGEQFSLGRLIDNCKGELINEDFEQLNYLKFDLVKCSFPIFQKLMDEYKLLASSLEIRGLKNNDLKSIIDDYCLSVNFSQQKKLQLYSRYTTKNNLLSGRQEPGCCRRSMIEMKKQSQFVVQALTPKKVKKYESQPLSPFSLQIGKQVKKESVIFDSQNPQIKQSKNLTEEVRRVIEESHSLHKKLYSQMVEVKLNCSKNQNEKQIKQGFSSIQQQLGNLQKELKEQEEQIIELGEQMAQGKTKRKATTGIDLIFGY